MDQDVFEQLVVEALDSLPAEITAWLDTVAESSLARFPWFEQVALDRRASWWGYYEITPDHNAIIGTDPAEPHWLNACGFSGHGVQQAAAHGRLGGRVRHRAVHPPSMLTDVPVTMPASGPAR